MRKKFLIISLLVILSSSFFVSAEGWSWPLYIGFSLPQTTITYENATEDTKVHSYVFQAGSLWVNDASGFTFKLSTDIGLGGIEDVDKLIRDTEISAGLGFTFLRTEKVFLSTTFCSGMGFITYSDHYSTSVYGVTYSTDSDITSFWIDLGGDIDLHIWFNGVMGIYAGCAIRGVVFGASTNKYTMSYKKDGKTKYETDSANSNWDKGIRITPAIGMTFRL